MLSSFLDGTIITWYWHCRQSGFLEADDTDLEALGCWLFGLYTRVLWAGGTGEQREQDESRDQIPRRLTLPRRLTDQIRCNLKLSKSTGWVLSVYIMEGALSTWLSEVDWQDKKHVYSQILTIRFLLLAQ